MTKADIVTRIATATGITKLETEILVDGFFKTMTDALANGDHIEIRGFGTFRTKKRPPRMARNPRTGEAVPLGEHFVSHRESFGRLSTIARRNKRVGSSAIRYHPIKTPPC
jgi:nucleoid DNA-binding protein